LAQAQDSAVEWLGNASSDERKSLLNELAQTSYEPHYGKSGERLGIVSHLLDYFGNQESSESSKMLA